MNCFHVTKLFLCHGEVKPACITHGASHIGCIKLFGYTMQSIRNKHVLNPDVLYHSYSFCTHMTHEYDSSTPCCKETWRNCCCFASKKKTSCHDFVHPAAMSLKLSGSEFRWIQPQQQKVTCFIGALGIQSYCEDGMFRPSIPTLGRGLDSYKTNEGL